MRWMVHHRQRRIEAWRNLRSSCDSGTYSNGLRSRKISFSADFAAWVAVVAFVPVSDIVADPVLGDVELSQKANRLRARYIRSLERATARNRELRGKFTSKEYRKIFSINSTGRDSSLDSLFRVLRGVAWAPRRRARLTVSDWELACFAAVDIIGLPPLGPEGIGLGTPSFGSHGLFRRPRVLIGVSMPC